jgi:dihydroneopterin aldolase
MLTVLSCTGLQFYGFHGFFAPERELGQKFTLDIRCELQAQETHADDNLHSSVRYDAVVDEAMGVATGSKFRTLEALGEATARALLARFAQIEHVTVEVSKLSPPIQHSIQKVAVEVQLARTLAESSHLRRQPAPGYARRPQAAQR